MTAVPNDVLQFLWGNNVPRQLLTTPGGQHTDNPRHSTNSKWQQVEPGADSNISYQIPTAGSLVSRHLPGEQHATPTHPSGHTGIDISNSTGTPVYAIGPGYVADIGVGKKGGNWVTTKHEQSSVRAYYAHLDSINVSKGQQVDHSTVIGAMGDTGNAKGRGSHLHFQVAVNDTQVDPLSIKGKRVGSLTG